MHEDVDSPDVEPVMEGSKAPRGGDADWTSLSLCARLVLPTCARRQEAGDAAVFPCELRKLCIDRRRYADALLDRYHSRYRLAGGFPLVCTADPLVGPL